MKQRIITGLIGAIVFLPLLYLGGVPYTLLLFAMALVGYDEFLKMLGIGRTESIAWMGYIFLSLMLIPQLGWLPQMAHSNLLQMSWLALFLLLSLSVFSKNKHHYSKVSSVWAAVFYIAFGFYYIMETRLIEDGLIWTLLILLSTWASDSGAYFSGRWMGRNKLWPAISPNKTIEGSVGGILSSAAVSIAFAIFFPEVLTIVQALFLGVAISVVGQLGDLIQSAYKRHYGVKDSGQLFPGHGGILDRTDSWLIVFPFLHFVGLIA